jgi:hypothetical protein
MRSVLDAAVKANAMPLDHMLAVLRDPNTEPHRRDQMAVAAAPYCHPKLIATAVSQVRTDPQLPPGQFREWAQQRIKEVFGDTLPSMGGPVINPTPGNPPPRVIEHAPVEVEAADRSPADAPDDARGVSPIGEPVGPEPDGELREDELLPAEAAMRRRVVPLRGPRGEDAF